MEALWRVTPTVMARLASILFRWRVLLVVMALAASVWFAVEILDSSASSPRALLALAGFLWALLALGTAHTLSRAPDAISAKDGIASRWRKRLGLAVYWLGCLSFLGLTALTLLLTVRALGLLAG